MRCFARLVVGVVLGVVGCSEPGNAGGCGGKGGMSECQPSVITVGCRNSFSGSTSILDWELHAVPDTIESGKPFNVSLGGMVALGEDFPLYGAQNVVGIDFFSEVNLVELNAMVSVRSGADGADVVLTVDEDQFDYVCARSRTSCDPGNDLEGTPGLRGNTDCQPESPVNPCGRFIPMPTSRDCGPDGPCDEANQTGPSSQCERNGFCITGDLQIPLAGETGRYTAASEGEVVFGWADGEITGATIQESGADEGAWILPQADYREPAGALALRVSAGGLPVALECTMGVDSRGAHGVNSLNSLSSPTPDSLLPSFPIQVSR